MTQKLLLCIFVLSLYYLDLRISMTISSSKKYKQSTMGAVTVTVLHLLLTLSIVMEDWMKNWIDIAEWRENERKKQNKERKMREGIEAFRGKAREFFNVDARAEYRVEAKEREEKEQRRLEERLEERRQEEANRGINAREFFNIDARAEYRVKAKEREEKEKRRLEERRQEEERMKKEMQDEEDKKEQERRKEQQDEEEQSQSLFAIHSTIAKKKK